MAQDLEIPLGVYKASGAIVTISLQIGNDRAQLRSQGISIGIWCVSLRRISVSATVRNGRINSVQLGGLDVPLAVFVFGA